MRLTRRIVTIAASVMCALALAACGKQVVAHVTASDSVHSALTSVFTSPTPQYVVTVQGLPGQAASAARPARISTGHGLQNLEKRLAAGGGHCVVTSEPGKGTRVELTVRTEL